jgi:hypothetical protein
MNQQNLLVELVLADLLAIAWIRTRVAMRATLFGLQFRLDDGILENLQSEKCAVNSSKRQFEEYQSN